MEYVACDRAEERLLLSLLDRIDRLEQTVLQSLTQPAPVHPLSNIDPANCPDEMTEARRLADSLAGRAQILKKKGENWMSSYIRFSRNADMLRARGFELKPARDSADVNFYTITWPAAQV